MRGKRLLALLLCMVMAFQLVPCAFAEEQAQDAADFSVYAPGEIDITIGEDGGISISPKEPAIYNGVETKAVAVTSVQIAAKDGWTLVPSGEPFPEDAAQAIGVSLNGADIDADGMLDLSGLPWVIEGGGKLPLDFNIKLPDSLPREDVPGILTITYTFDWAEEEAPETTFIVEYDNGLMLPESNNTATFKWSNAPDDFELAGITSSDPSIAKVSEVFDSASESQQVEVKAIKRGVAKFTGVSTTGETASFDVLVSELSGDSRPSASIDKTEEVKPGDTIAPDDVTVEIPTVTPDGGTDTITVTPDDVSGGEIEEGRNVVSATVDANGVDITINIIINITINQGTPVDPTDHTHTITINPDGGGGHADSSDPLKTDRDGKVPELPTVTPDEGYVFDQWTDEAGDEVKTGDTIDDDVTITPTFKPDENYKVYTITIEPGEHGRADDDSPLKTDSNGKVPALPSVTPDESYVFDKWVDEGVSEIKPYDILDRDVTITPTFKQDNTHTLTPVDGDHGTVVDKTPIKTDANGVVQGNFPNVTLDSRYEFDKWVYIDSGEEVNPGDILTEDVKIKFIAVKGDNTHTLTPIDGDHGTVDDKSPIKTDRNGVVQNNFPNITPENNYEIKGWVDTDGVEVKPGDVLDEDITITPILKLKKQSFTVNFDVQRTWDPQHKEKTLPCSVEISVDNGSVLTFNKGYKSSAFDSDNKLWLGPSYINLSNNVRADEDITFNVKLNDNMTSMSYYINYVGIENPKEPDGKSLKTFYSYGYNKKTQLTEITCTIDSSDIQSFGNKLYINVVIGASLYLSNYAETYYLTPVDGDHGIVTNKSIISTDEYGVLRRSLPTVTPDSDYNLEKWVDENGHEVNTGCRFSKDMVITPIYKFIGRDNTHILTPVDGDHGAVPDKAPIKTDKRGVVQNNLPNVTPDSGYGFEKWIDIDSGNEIAPGDRLTEDVTIKPVFAIDNTHTLTPVDGDQCTVADKTPIKTDVNGVVQDNFPSVTHDEAYKVEKWLYVDSGEIVKPGDVLTKDVYIKPVLAVDNGPYTIYFQAANYYTLSDTTPLTTSEGRKIPMDQMPEVSPIVSHFFDGAWVNVDTNEVINAETKLKSDITVKPQINCLFTEGNGAVTGFSDYAQDKNVESITIPNNIMGKTVTRIGTTAFSAHINHRTDSDGVTRSDPNPKALEVKHVVIEEGITELGKQSFGSYNIFESMNLESVSLPDGLKVIGEGAFYECRKLPSITIPDTVTTIGDAAFWDNAALSSVSLGSSVRFLGYRAFMHCTALRSIALPSSLRTIDGACFEGSGLESVTVPDGCSVGNSAFIFCDNLRYATLGEGTKSLYTTFQRCPNLRSVRLPRSITSINPNAFYYCPNLAYIYIKGAKNSVSGAPWGSSQTSPTVIWTS